MNSENNPVGIKRSEAIVGILIIIGVLGALVYATSLFLAWLQLQIEASFLIVAEPGSPLEGWMWLLNPLVPVALMLLSFYMLLDYIRETEPMPMVPPHLVYEYESETDEYGDEDADAEEVDDAAE